jgi:hypothetical protein
MKIYLYLVWEDSGENLKSDFLYLIDKNYRQGHPGLFVLAGFNA